MRHLVSALLLAASVMVPAVAADKSPAEIAKQLGVPAANVKPSPIPGLYEVTKDHRFGYVSASGRYFLQGDMIDMVTKDNLTEADRRQDRLNALTAMGPQNFIDFPPPPPIKTRYVVTVFTDITCPFCRRLHAMMSEFNKRGIEIRYAFFPRSGPNTSAFVAAESVWCSKDRRSALDKAFADAEAGKPLPQANAGCQNPVLSQYELGRELGLRGTPMLILPSGEKVDGYLMPDDLDAALQNKPDDSAPPTGLVNP